MDVYDLKVGDIVTLPDGATGEIGILGIPRIPMQARITDVIKKSSRYYDVEINVFGRFVKNGSGCFTRSPDKLSVEPVDNRFFVSLDGKELYIKTNALADSFIVFRKDGSGRFKKYSKLLGKPECRPLYKNEQYELARC